MSDEKSSPKILQKVKARVRANSAGQYQGVIVPIGHIFIYEGNLNAKGTLPLWVDLMDGEEIHEIGAPKAAAEKKSKAPVAKKAPVAPKAPVAKPAPGAKAKVASKKAADVVAPEAPAPLNVV